MKDKRIKTLLKHWMEKSRVRGEEIARLKTLLNDADRLLLQTTRGEFFDGECVYCGSPNPEHKDSCDYDVWSKKVQEITK